MKKEDIIKLIQLQAKTINDINDILILVREEFVTGKKITKRNIDKAQKLINEKYPPEKREVRNSIYKDGVEGIEVKEFPQYRIYKDSDYFNYIKIYASNRCIITDQGHYQGAVYIATDSKELHLGHEWTITDENYSRYIGKKTPIPTAKQIESYIEKYKAIEEKIQGLKDKKNSIPFRIYFKDLI